MAQAAADTISDLLRDDASFRSAFRQDPMVALTGIGLGGVLAVELAIEFSRIEEDMAGYAKGIVQPACPSWLTKPSCCCTMFVADQTGKTRCVHRSS